jgi:putative flippase GtrA
VNPGKKYRSRPTIVQFFRSLVAAWAAFFVDWGVLEILVLFSHGDPALLKLFSYPFAVLTTYLLSRYWVFSNPRYYRTAGELVLYLAGTAVSLGISAGSIWLLTDALFMMNFRFSNAIGMALVFLWNFVYRKFVVFRAETGDNAVSTTKGVEHG